MPLFLQHIEEATKNSCIRSLVVWITPRKVVLHSIVCEKIPNVPVVVSCQRLEQCPNIREEDSLVVQISQEREVAVYPEFLTNLI